MVPASACRAGHPRIPCILWQPSRPVVTQAPTGARSREAKATTVSSRWRAIRELSKLLRRPQATTDLIAGPRSTSNFTNSSCNGARPQAALRLAPHPHKPVLPAPDRHAGEGLGSWHDQRTTPRGAWAAAAQRTSQAGLMARHAGAANASRHSSPRCPPRRWPRSPPGACAPPRRRPAPLRTGGTRPYKISSAAHTGISVILCGSQPARWCAWSAPTKSCVCWVQPGQDARCWRADDGLWVAGSPSRRLDSLMISLVRGLRGLGARATGPSLACGDRWRIPHPVNAVHADGPGQPRSGSPGALTPATAYQCRLGGLRLNIHRDSVVLLTRGPR